MSKEEDSRGDKSNLHITHDHEKLPGVGSSPHALHGDPSMTAPQSSDKEAMRIENREDATHLKKLPMQRMGTRVMLFPFRESGTPKGLSHKAGDFSHRKLILTVF